MMRRAARWALSKSPLVDGVFRRFFWSRVHFPEHELRVLHALPDRIFDVAVDVGAALGSYTWVLNRKAHDVIAFEPGNLHFAHINAARYLSRVRVINAAAGASECSAELIIPSETNDGRHLATLATDNPLSRASTAKKQTVRVVALSPYLDANLTPDRRVDLLKIDVEGFENAVLAGALARINRDHPVIIAEVESRYNPDYAVFFEKLSRLGYTCHGYRSGAYVPFSAADAGAQDAPVPSASTGSPRMNTGYVNNFVFQHANSAVKVLPR